MDEAHLLVPLEGSHQSSEAVARPGSFYSRPPRSRPSRF